MDIRDMVKGDLLLDEGKRNFPYRDTVGKLTIGVGRNLDDVGLSDREVMILLENDIEMAVNSLKGKLPWVVGLPLSQQRALINMAFQLGVGGLLKFEKMLAALEAGDYSRAAKEAMDSRWAKQTPNRAKRVVALLEGKGN